MPQVFEDIIVDAEFAALIPPLSAEERQQLEDNIAEHGGARDPLVVWASKGTLTLLDGHNRYEICTRLGLPFDIHEMSFKSREDATHWIVKNQLGRRNLTADSFTYLLGLDYKLEKKAHGKRGPEKTDQNEQSFGTAERIAREVGVSPATVRRAEKFYEEVERTPELKQAVEEGRPVLQVKRELKEAAREARREENRQKIASVPEPEQAASVSDAKFATIVIDPPWDWGDEGDQDQLGRARPDYGTMSIEQLERINVGGLADDDCHIYLWITNRSLPKGFRLLEAWGFRYITAITWVKPHFGMGNYFRGQTEHVLFGVKGSQPLKRKDAGTSFTADRGSGGHSSKPPAFLELVESCSPGPYIEMFSRSSRDGWVTWGEDCNGLA
jgi:N6-adenosine-specific RNA methylase IME4/transposase-like protein